MICHSVRTERRGLVLAALLLMAGAAGVAQTTRTANPFEGCTVELIVPEGWGAAEARNPQNGVQTIELRDPAKEVLLDLSFLPDVEGQLSTRASLEARMGEVSQMYLEGAVETTMRLTFFDAPTGPAAWASFTDRSLMGKPIPVGQKLISTTGLRSWNGAYLFFTLLADSVEAASYSRALEVVKGGITVKTREATPARKAETRADALVVTELADAFELTVPVSQLVLRLPKSGFKQATPLPGGSTGAPRYFIFKDEQNHLVVSGWFEPQDRFQGIDSFWADELAVWSKDVPKPEGVSFRKVGNWEVVAYNIPYKPASNPNIRAHWLQAGTWIDLHLSIMSELPKADAAASLEAVLSQIRVGLKKP